MEGRLGAALSADPNGRIDMHQQAQPCYNRPILLFSTAWFHNSCVDYTPEPEPDPNDPAPAEDPVWIPVSKTYMDAARDIRSPTSVGTGALGVSVNHIETRRVETDGRRQKEMAFRNAPYETTGPKAPSRSSSSPQTSISDPSPTAPPPLPSASSASSLTKEDQKPAAKKYEKEARRGILVTVWRLLCHHSANGARLCPSLEENNYRFRRS
ncbi:hypothetical protein BDK51DRAFT_48120 [Blyttiomyces helicus]|uniref:Uncharacterized protein n=1 Tax=Blyttiomyces helicus TaxID=388810 RepID=A0A4P9VZR2_9FUNG|nr:hypothetical protein BDK51DRAFT_48120 [Blyttiomyces helicus]|eukprot:RKO85319.1 hypothetical protein BDK51DRAFT_48120 [Blyttiomyces helicus]